MTAGVRTGKAQNEHMFYRFAPEIGHPICAATSTNYLSIGIAKRARVGAHQGATLGADHLVWGGLQFPCRRCGHTNARFEREAYREIRDAGQKSRACPASHLLQDERSGGREWFANGSRS